jgi:hypothetical protein
MDTLTLPDTDGAQRPFSAVRYGHGGPFGKQIIAVHTPDFLRREAEKQWR